MSKIDPDTLQPGRELDALIAEKVMGCKVERHEHPSGSPNHPPIVHWECRCEEVPVHYHAACTPFPHKHGRYEGTREIKQYSERIAAAWEVVEAMIARSDRYGYHIYVMNPKDGKHSAHYGVARPGSVHLSGDTTHWDSAYDCDTVPLAICRAALKAVQA